MPTPPPAGSSALRVRFGSTVPSGFRLVASEGGAASGDGSPTGSLEGELHALRTRQEATLTSLASMNTALRREVERLRTCRTRFAEEMEQIVHGVVCLTAETIFDRIIEHDEYRIADIVKPALEMLERGGFGSASRLRLNPHDLDRLRLDDNGSPGGSLTEILGPVELMADESVPRASCVLQSPAGDLVSDARIAFEELATRLRAWRPQLTSIASALDGDMPPGPPVAQPRQDNEDTPA